MVDQDGFQSDVVDRGGVIVAQLEEVAGLGLVLFNIVEEIRFFGCISLYFLLHITQRLDFPQSYFLILGARSKVLNAILHLEFVGGEAEIFDGVLMTCKTEFILKETMQFRSLLRLVFASIPRACVAMDVFVEATND